MKKLAAGNWKMNGLAAHLSEAEALAGAHAQPGCEVLICPPATLIARMAQTLGDAPIALGGQDCHSADSGAHTGDVSAVMLKDAGASYVILGHSERRTDHKETDAAVRVKTEAAWRSNLTAIVCIGETLAEREDGKTLDVVGTQMKGALPDGCTAENVVVAYEPVWAIGTGKVPTMEQIAEVHDFMRTELTARFGDAAAGIRLLYGGSVKPDNADEIFAVSNVDGALVGGASLKADDFGGIIGALERA
ncbi:triose-phosphate isomerase [Psychromarinibacter sp. C21-152]|uniref:Triosephosphate isomerase n=1 Tax=Psychromarinibacter sediminicola TaxID=3033385 RepID=A0AAE3TBE4_9RHOB|nr:triose-phosphate isomerase [Psychromarinibacter sediminicola]MDF0602949.1 triose-phosphate isomerase [Psychromarinibacter sediminicola]